MNAGIATSQHNELSGVYVIDVDEFSLRQKKSILSSRADWSFQLTKGWRTNSGSVANN